MILKKLLYLSKTIHIRCLMILYNLMYIFVKLYIKIDPKIFHIFKDLVSHTKIWLKTTQGVKWK